jgi:hypothetical protein
VLVAEPPIHSHTGREMSLMNRERWLKVCTCCLLLGCSFATPAREAASIQGDLAIPLLATAGGFLKEVDTVEPQRLSRYFPRRGEFTHRRTIYAAGRDSVAERRYPAEILPDALNGPLYPVFRTEQHRQPIGPFAHQVVIRGRGWKYVGSNRFVPPDADETSVVYMIWRLEDERWVIAEIADELYLSGQLPPWCC